MRAVKWSRRALRSLDAIGDVIARDNPERAVAFTHEIFRRTDDLARFPYLGRPSVRPDVRELVVHKNYLVSYRVEHEAVTVLQVWHAAQDRPA
ncbi:MAG: type II toxin-antitoxin system RelE/ParE family toxin [Chloroflexi bacterium CFX7]|nr:type II toxin-antitoxin system RelE/ParE family toxin [Chloroflexi bacterium CFX7]